MTGHGTGRTALPRGRHPRGARARAAVAAATLALLLSPVAPAHAGPARAEAADAAEGGLWYYEVPRLADVHASGVRGQGVTVAVLDGTINPEAPDLVGTNLSVRPDSTCADDSGGFLPATSTARDAVHATGMVSLIIGNGAGAEGRPGVLGVAPDARVHHYAIMVGDPASGEDDICASRTSLADGIDLAIADEADILSLSISSEYDPDAEDALLRALRAGVIVVAAGAGQGYPGKHNGVVTVESAEPDGSLYVEASPEPDVVAPGEGILSAAPAEDGSWTSYSLASGASSATAWTAGALALAWSAHPDATSNQIIQTLVRHTAGAEGQLGEPDLTIGYGYVSVSAMLAADPTAYPDSNPLLLADHFAGPALEDVLGSPTPTPGPSPADSAAPTPTAPGQSSPRVGDGAGAGTSAVPLAVGLGALALLGVLLAVLLRRRSQAQRPTSPDAPREDDR